MWNDVRATNNRVDLQIIHSNFCRTYIINEEYDSAEIPYELNLETVVFLWQERF